MGDPHGSHCPCERCNEIRNMNEEWGQEPKEMEVECNVCKQKIPLSNQKFGLCGDCMWKAIEEGGSKRFSLEAELDRIRQLVTDLKCTWLERYEMSTKSGTCLDLYPSTGMCRICQLKEDVFGSV